MDLPAVGRRAVDAAIARTGPGASPSSTGRACGTARRTRLRSRRSVAARSSRWASSRSVSRAAGRLGTDSVSNGQAAQNGTTACQLVGLGRRPAGRRSPGRRSRAAGARPVRAVIAPPGSPSSRRGLDRAAPCRPRPGRADAGSRRPSPRPGSRRPGPSGTRAPSSVVCVRPEVDDPADRRRATCRRASGRGAGEKQTTRHVPRSPSARRRPCSTAAIGRVRPQRAKSLAKTNVSS